MSVRKSLISRFFYTRMVFGRKDLMDRIDNKIAYENEIFPAETVLPDIDFRTPSDGEFDPRFAKMQRRRTIYSITNNRMVQINNYHISGMNYIVNSCFDLQASRPADDGVKYLLEMDIQKASEKVS